MKWINIVRYLPMEKSYFETGIFHSGLCKIAVQYFLCEGNNLIFLLNSFDFDIVV